MLVIHARSWKMRTTRTQVGLGAATLGVSLVAALLAIAATTSGASSPTSLDAKQILRGVSLHHSFTPVGSTTSKSETLADPDDITQLGTSLFVGFQNGVGPQGEASTSGNRDSTIVECTTTGHVLGQWDVAGKADGVTADPALNAVIVTVNEDAHSSLFVINPNPSPGRATHYTYSEALPHFGGTDAISIDSGRILISASAPGTSSGKAPNAAYPAVYTVTLDATTMVAKVTPLFFDEAMAKVANPSSFGGHASDKLALVDPDSNEVVPSSSPRFAGDFMLTSQGDMEQIFLSNVTTSRRSLTVLKLTQSVDDTAWATAPSGTIYATDSTNDAVDALTGSMRSGEVFVAVTPCGANTVPATCPAPPTFPNNYMATSNLVTGAVTPITVHGGPFIPQGGLHFIASR
jgi:hypothetical protein